MAEALVPDDLLHRWSRARATSLEYTEHATRLVQGAAAACSWAHQVLLDAIKLREWGALPRPELTIDSFCIEGEIEGLPTEAHFEDGRLRCSEELLRRAEVLVAMGETFHSPGTRVVAATLDGPVAPSS